MQPRIRPASWCAQRLTAIRGKSLPLVGNGQLRHPRAQRLTAIRGKSLQNQIQIRQWIQCSTPYGNQRKITNWHPRDRPKASRVLNALRQSEENHTTEVTQGRDGSAVLNALRQSEENHLVKTVPGALRRIVLNALRQSEENHAENPCWAKLSAADSAQRLTAIRGKSRRSPDRGSGCWPRCSTPYGNQRKITRS